MRDNEKILEAIAECQSCLKANLVKILNADGNAEVIRSFSEAILCIDRASCSIGDRNRNMEIGEFLGARFDPDFAQSVATELLAPVEKRLHDLIEKIEKWEGDRHD